VLDGATPYSVPSNFDRTDEVCDVPSTASYPQSTLSGGTHTDEGGPVYTMHITNAYGLPNKRKFPQTVAKSLELNPGAAIHTDSTAVGHLNLHVVPQIPAPLTVTFTHDNGMQTTVTTQTSHTVPVTLTFLSDWGTTHHSVHAHLVDANGNTFDTDTVVTVYKSIDN